MSSVAPRRSSSERRPSYVSFAAFERFIASLGDDVSGAVHRLARSANQTDRLVFRGLGLLQLVAGEEPTTVLLRLARQAPEARFPELAERIRREYEWAWEEARTLDGFEAWIASRWPTSKKTARASAAFFVGVTRAAGLSPPFELPPRGRPPGNRPTGAADLNPDRSSPVSDSTLYELDLQYYQMLVKEGQRQVAETGRFGASMMKNIERQRARIRPGQPSDSSDRERGSQV